jgi:alanine dehydrogenase
MIVGILREIKPEENRVRMTPAGVEVMKQNGHTVLVEKDAFTGSGFSDEAYVNAGADIIADPQGIFEKSDMVMHVKEPQPSEYEMIRPGQIVYTYLHLGHESGPSSLPIRHYARQLH